jgi:membrane protein
MRKRLKDYASRHRIIRFLERKAKHISLPGFDKVPVFYVGQFFLKEMGDERISMQASSIAFYFLMALFPAILFFFTLIPIIPIEGFQNTLFDSISKVLPDASFSFITGAIEDIIKIQRFDLLSIGFLMAFFFSTQGVNALTKAFHRDQVIFRRRSWLQRKLVVVKLTAVLFVLMVFSVVLVILGNQLVNLTADWFGISNRFEVFLLSLLRWIIILMTFFTTISFIYYYAPATEKRWRFITVGSTVATAISLVSSLVFAFVVNNFNLYNEIYGSIGAFLAMIVWLYMNAMALLIGFELNYSIKYQHYVRMDEQGASRPVE